RKPKTGFLCFRARTAKAPFPAFPSCGLASSPSLTAFRRGLPRTLFGIPLPALPPTSVTRNRQLPLLSVIRDARPRRVTFTQPTVCCWRQQMPYLVTSQVGWATRNQAWSCNCQVGGEIARYCPEVKVMHSLVSANSCASITLYASQCLL